MTATKPTDVILCGYGAVGQAFYRQLLPFCQVSANTQTAPLLRIRAILNSTHIYMVSSDTEREEADSPISPDQLNIKEHGTAIAHEQSDSTAYILNYIKSCLRPDDAKLCVIDATASSALSNMYPDILSMGCHMVTANKIALSAPSDHLFDRLRPFLPSPAPTSEYLRANQTGASLSYEATVGAALPIICTLRDLLATGDKIRTITGVFSGTLSYIFNTYSAEPYPSFSSVVQEAKAAGYTEPHPALDLCGMDVARKLTILARTCSAATDLLPQGAQSVQTDSLVPAHLANLTDPAEFLSRLPELDAEFDRQRTEARADGSVLRYTGTLDLQTGTARASLQRYAQGHALAGLSGSDNVVLITSDRYPAAPLVIRGSGAGADVTAMALLRDVLHLQRG